jgi:arylesterase / paraoxonase
MIIASGSVGYCNSTTCAPALPGTSRPPVPYPNGLIAVPSRSRPNTHLVYVPSSLTGAIAIYELSQFSTKEQPQGQPEILNLGSKAGKLKHISTIQVPHPVDNLSVDSDGAIWAAGFPKLYIWLESSKRPWEVNPPCSAWKIQTLEGVKGEAEDGEIEYEFKIEKMLEDDGSVLPGATVVVHDAARGTLFFGGSFDSFLLFPSCAYPILPHPL